MSTLRTDERGWALISVLVVVTALSMLAAATQSLVATGLRAEQRAWEAARQESLLDAGVNAAVLGIVTAKQDERWRVDGTAREFVFEGRSLRIAIQDERGRIDLNSADGSILKELFLSVGVREDDVRHIVDSILDWRSSSSLDFSNAATDAEYRARGYRARHEAFQSVDELQLVSGISPRVFERVGGALTVYSRLPTIDESVAPREVLVAMNKL